MKNKLFLTLCLCAMILLIPFGVKAADYAGDPTFADAKLIVDCFEKNNNDVFTTILNKNNSLQCLLTIENVDSSLGVTKVYGEISSQDFGNNLKINYVDELSEIDIDYSDPKNLKFTTTIGSYAIDDEDRWLFLGYVYLDFSDELKKTTLVEDNFSTINFLNFKINDIHSISDQTLKITLAKNTSSSNTSNGSSSSSSNASTAADKLQTANNKDKGNANNKVNNPNTADTNVLLLSLSCILLSIIGIISLRKVIKV